MNKGYMRCMNVARLCRTVRDLSRTGRTHDPLTASLLTRNRKQLRFSMTQYCVSITPTQLDHLLIILSIGFFRKCVRRKILNYCSLVDSLV